MTIKKLLLITAVATSFGYSQSSEAGMDAYLGEIQITPYNFCPRGSIPADGQLLAISSNTALFSLYGTTFGGDGRSTFGIPDLRGRAPIHLGTGPGLTSRTWGQRGGTENTTLTVNNLPAHNHRAGI